MRLFIAEKPSLGRAIANALPKPLVKSDGYITAANGDTVSWCIGHLLEQVEPEVYDPAYKKWSHEHLPIIPDQWQLTAKKKTAKQLRVLGKLVKKADKLVHAGDPDREGQLLVDEVINFFGVSGTKKNTIQRCLISDLNTKAVKRAIADKALRSNRDFIPLSISALARSRADWLYGINLTRAYTLQGQKGGYNGVLSVGRVQTPVLGLVVRRDQAIENFVSKPYYQVWANLTNGSDNFKAKWQPSQECEKFLDDHGRNTSRALAENVARRISNQSAQVSKLERNLKKIPPPLPYNLSALQIDANKAFGLNAQQVLDVCQTLYERHTLITYPRSDCRYIPKDQFIQAKAVIESIQHNSAACGAFEKNLSATSPSANLFNLSQRSRAWNDSKVSAHHAIIPTEKKLSAAKLNGLNADEAKIYGLVARNYLAQFLPEHEFYAVRVEVKIGTGLFVATAKEQKAEGWKCLFLARATQSSKKPQEKPQEDDDPVQTIPQLKTGQQLRSNEAEVIEKNTSPPKSYTDASLLSAMTGISAHVQNPQLKKVLKETDGLGTEATRAGIIELLFKRGYLLRKGKSISATPTGSALINALPVVATFPDMTALWESQLSAIHDGQGSYQQLMSPLTAQLESLVVESRGVIPKGLNGLGKKPSFKKRKASKYKSTKSVKLKQTA